MEIKFKINGFHCGACVKLATMKIKKIEGVQEVNIEESGSSVIESERDVLTEIEEVVSGLGYSLEK